MDLYLLRPMIDRSRFERKKTVTPTAGEEGRRRWKKGMDILLEKENG
jgi:hypothetical protein